VVSERFAPRDIDRGAAFTGFSPKISLQRELASGDLVYAVISVGYRAGGVNSGGARPLEPAALETFAPDRLRNYEVGLKLERMDRRLSLNSAAFYAEWKDIQTDQFRVSGIPFTTNAGDAQILGLESELAFHADNGLSAQLQGRLSRTRMTNPNTDFTSDLVNGLPGAPAVSGGAVVSYQRELFDGGLLKLVGETTYVGRSRVAFDATSRKMGGYTRTKLLAELSGQTFGVQVFVTNPLNAFSDTFAFGNSFNPTQTPQITPQRPRTVGVTLFAGY
jgi:iron complex outermembrane receptor protein